MRKLSAADLFCGAGGFSTGLIQAARKAGGFSLDLLAVNHWDTAVATHELNHPWARHKQADISSLDPNKMFPSGKLDMLIASPECTHHSLALGGKPCSEQSRASGWHVVHWAERLMPTDILLENVKEWAGWGPLMSNNRPDPKRKGETFQAFLASLRSLGYLVEHRVLDASDFGDATSRKRLFVRATRRKKIKWPTATHSECRRPASAIIDWNLRGESIRNRRRPLKPKTLRRIEVGLRKFGGEAFIAVLRGTSEQQSDSWATSINAPIGTVSAGGVHAALCQPFIIPMEHGGRAALRGVDEPLPTITTAKGGAFGLCQPFVMNVAHAGGDSSRCRSVSEPLSTIPAGHRGELALIEPRPFLTKYYGTGGAASVDEPLDTVTAKGRFALVEPSGHDVYFRMLQPHELAAAMGFDGYKFCGNKTDQIRQIGNAVSVRTAQALCASILEGYA